MISCHISRQSKTSSGSKASILILQSFMSSLSSRHPWKQQILCLRHFHFLLHTCHIYSQTLQFKENKLIVSWEPERHYQYSKLFGWEPEGALWLYNVSADDSTLLVLNGISLNLDSAFLVLINGTSLNLDSAFLVLNGTSLNLDSAVSGSQWNIFGSRTATFWLSIDNIWCHISEIGGMENRKHFYYKILSFTSMCTHMLGTLIALALWEKNGSFQILRAIFVKFGHLSSPG